MSWREKRYFADCPIHGTQELDWDKKPWQSNRLENGSWVVKCQYVLGIEERISKLDGYKATVEIQHSQEVPLRVVKPRQRTAGKNTGCDGRCLNGKYSCDCSCNGRCHGLGRCICNTPI